MSASDLIAQYMLRNGRAGTFRAARSDDRARIAGAFHQLDRQSVYTRFFTCSSEPGDAGLAPIDAVDCVRQAMLVATIRNDDDEIVIGLATTTRTTHPTARAP